MTMEDIHIAHLAGVFDAVGTITGHITKKESQQFNYRFDPLVRLYRPADQEALLGKFDAYCEEQTLQYSSSVIDRSGTETYVMNIKKPDAIERFLMPMMPYFAVKHEYAEIMLDRVLPLVRTDQHLTKEGFYELVGYTEILRETGRHGTAKYTQEFFEEEWEESLERAT